MALGLRGLCALFGLLAAATWRYGETTVAPVAGEPSADRHASVGATTYALWFALAFVPSVLLLATTNQVCLDVASVPFMWVLPLSLYLLSFVLGFNQVSWNQRRFFAPICYLAAGLFGVMLNWSADASILVQAGGYFLALFACCMFCHGELARLRPPPAQLTSFYLTMSGAGAAGGVFVSLLAPRLFNSYLELHFAVLAALALAIYVSYRNRDWPFGVRPRRPKVALVAKLAIGSLCVAVLVLLTRAEWRGNSDLVYQTRSFFGVLRVLRRPQPNPADNMLSLRHGRISHGTQYLAPDKQRVPTSYYTRQSGVGLVLRAHHSDRPRRIGVVGLGTGTLAVYGRPGDQLTFFEIDADVDRIAREHFTFLRDCEAKWDVKLGDGRRSLELEQQRGDAGRFDVLVLDAFSGDAIPTHMLTREAMSLYLDRLADDGILAFHVSNRHLDLRPVLAASARGYQLASRVIAMKALRDMPPSTWVLLSRTPKAFDDDVYVGTKPLDMERQIPWTDNYCSLASVLNWGSQRAAEAGDRGPNSPLVDRGVALIEANDLKNAESLLRDALKSDQRDAGAWLHLGNVLRRQSRPAEAINAYRRAVEAAPQYAEAHNNFGMLLFKVDRQKGRHHVAEAIRLDPRSVEAHNNLGLILAEESDLQGALRQFEQALALDPDSDAARKNSDVVRSMLRTSAAP